MNLFQSLVYAAVLYALWRCRKDWTMEQLFLPLVILGGFSFHTLWEAKSQYIFPYFVCLLPWAAAGLWRAGEDLLNLAERNLAERKKEMKIRKNAEEK